MTTPGSHGPGEQPPSGGSGWGPPAGSPQPASPQPGSPAPGSVPPPPPGQYPPQQGQFPQGQYAQQQGQFPSQQGQYPPQQGQQFPQGQGWAPQQAPKKGGAGKWVAIAGGILALLVIGLVAFALLGGGDPEAGDCLQEEGEELSVVDCDDSAAAWKLLGIQEGEQSYDEYLADPETCAAFPETVQSFWVGENGDESGQGVVYCVTTP
jgi:hypothetical protein